MSDLVEIIPIRRLILMLMFNTHNRRMKTSGAGLSEAQMEPAKNYRERYLELDATAWC